MFITDTNTWIETLWRHDLSLSDVLSRCKHLLVSVYLF